MWAALWSLFPSIFFCRSFEFLSLFFFNLFQTAVAAFRNAKLISCCASEDFSRSELGDNLAFKTSNGQSCNVLVGSISSWECRNWTFIYMKIIDLHNHKHAAELHRHSFNQSSPAAFHPVSYLRWQVAVVTLATRCSSAELVAVATGGGGLWGWRWQRRWWWPGRRRGCYWTGGLLPLLRSDWILARWLAWRRWAVGL